MEAPGLLTAADEVSVKELQSESGIDKIIKKLKEHFQPHPESAMPKAFERAVYGESRKSKESMQDYIIRLDKSFKELADEGVTLGDDVKGYILFRQGSLNTTQEDQVVTWTAGQYGRDVVVRALRNLEKVHKDRGGKSYVTADDKGMEMNETYAGFEQESDYETVNLVYMSEGDVHQIFDESSLQDALATYQRGTSDAQATTSAGARDQSRSHQEAGRDGDGQERPDAEGRQLGREGGDNFEDASVSPGRRSEPGGNCCRAGGTATQGSDGAATSAVSRPTGADAESADLADSLGGREQRLRRRLAQETMQQQEQTEGRVPK